MVVVVGVTHLSVTSVKHVARSFFSLRWIPLRSPKAALRIYGDVIQQVAHGGGGVEGGGAAVGLPVGAEPAEAGDAAGVLGEGAEGGAEDADDVAGGALGGAGYGGGVAVDAAAEGGPCVVLVRGLGDGEVGVVLVEAGAGEDGEGLVGGGGLVGLGLLGVADVVG